MAVLLKLDQLLNLIQDRTWHNLNELSKNSKIPKQKLETLSKLLSETNIIEYDTQKNHVRIKQEWQQILKNTLKQDCEKATIGTIVLPPKNGVNVQGIHVTNLTEKELELSLRINKKLEELAIGIID